MNMRIWILALALPALAPAQEEADALLYHRAVFFAVLEGLYVDGVDNEVVDRILLLDPETKAPMHFVTGCPLCNPAHDAFRVYRMRPKWLGYKGLPDDTFGSGLAPDVRAALASDDFAVRFQSIQKLIERWVRRRLELMRLTRSERTAWEIAFADMRKQGASLLRGSRGQIRKAKRCAVCDGAYLPFADK